MKKTLRTLALILALLFALSTAAFAADSDKDGYIIGSWKGVAMIQNGGDVEGVKEGVGVVFNADHTGILSLADSGNIEFAWNYMQEDESDYWFELKTADGLTFYAAYIFSYGTGSIDGNIGMLIDDLTLFFEKID